MGIELENNPDNVVSIKVIGVGGGGGNVVNRMVRSGVQGVEFVAVNTDKQALNISSATYKIQIGEKLTHGLGAGSKPEIGRKSAEESRNQVAKALENTDMVFITAGMGGGTGTGGAPIVAEIAHEMDILTVAVVTTPFNFEGAKRMRQAKEGIAELEKQVDSLVIIPNERLKFVSEQKITFANAFGIADDVLRQAVQSISDLIRDTGFINLDFADVSAVMKNAGMAHMGVGHGTGKTKAEDAAKEAISSPLLDSSIEGAHGVLINVTGSMDIGLDEVDKAATLVQEAVHPDALTIFGAIFDESMDDEMRVTVIATGFNKKDDDEELPKDKSADASAAPPAEPVRPQPTAAAEPPQPPMQPQMQQPMQSPIQPQMQSPMQQPMQPQMQPQMQQPMQRPMQPQQSRPGYQTQPAVDPAWSPVIRFDQTGFQDTFQDGDSGMDSAGGRGYGGQMPGTGPGSGSGQDSGGDSEDWDTLFKIFQDRRP